MIFLVSLLVLAIAAGALGYICGLAEGIEAGKRLNPTESKKLSCNSAETMKEPSL